MDEVTIYTDGACSGNPGPGGWGAVLICRGREKTISGGEAKTTNNRMELTAVIQALSQLSRPCIVDLYSDSSYVVIAVTKGWLKSWTARGWKKSDKSPVLNPDLWESLNDLLTKHRVIFHLVKGHNGDKYNEICDKIAVAESRKYQGKA